MATVSTRHCCSQSAKAWRSWVKVGNDRTESVSRSAGTATKISVAPISIPPALGLITGKLRSNFRCFRFFVFAMDRLRWFGNEPGVPEWGNLLRGIIATQTACCASPMLLCTGLGSNSLTGSPKQAPMGTRSTLTVAVSDVLEHVGDKAGPDPLHEFVFSLFMGMTNEKFLAVIGLAAGQLEILLGKGGVAAPIKKKPRSLLSVRRRGGSFQPPIIGSCTNHPVRAFHAN